MTTMTLTTEDTMTNSEWLTTMVVSTDEIAQKAYNKILDLVNNEGYPLDDIRDFIEGYGYAAFDEGHYETWAQITDQCGVSNDVVEAFVQEFGIDSIDGFEDSYCGTYRDGAEYAREMVESCYDMDRVPGFVEIDWEATWQNLSQDYTEVDGHIFNNHW